MCSTALVQAKALTTWRWRRSESRGLLALSRRRRDAVLHAGAERALRHHSGNPLRLWRGDDRHVGLPARAYGVALRLGCGPQRLHAGGAGGLRAAEMFARRLSGGALPPGVAAARVRPP